MAFPNTSVLDDATGADANPISHSGAWSMPIIPGDYNAQLLSHHITSAGTGWTSAYWNTSFGPDCEVFGTLTAGGYDFYLWWRVANPHTGSLSGYSANFQPGPDQVIIAKWTAGSPTTIATIIGTINNGDQVGIGMVGNLITAYVNGTSIGTVSDSTYTGAGYIGLGCYYNTGDGFNAFGGGTHSLAIPGNTIAPAISGSALVGNSIATDNGTWTNSPTSYTYQWQKSANGTTGWTNVGGATAATLAVDSSLLTQYLRCVVTATNAAGSASANSNVVGPVTSGVGGSTAFPSTPIRDNATRANENPVSNSGSYTQHVNAGDYDAQLLSNILCSANAGGWGSARWTGAFGPDCEVFGRMNAAGDTGWEYRLWLRVANGGLSSRTGYQIKAIKYNSIEVRRFDGATNTVIATFSTGLTWTATSRFGARMIGNTIFVYLDSTLIGQVTDNTYVAAGQIGFEQYGNTYGLTEFGGGTFVGPAPSAYIPKISWVRHHTPLAVPVTPPSTGTEGRIGFCMYATSQADQFTVSPAPTQAQKDWMNLHWTRSIIYLDQIAAWMTGGWGYNDMLQIYLGSPPVTQHPDWILKTAAGANVMYNGHYLADPGLPAYQAYKAGQVAAMPAKNYRGCHCDDVDLDRVVSGPDVINPRTGAAYTLATWQKDMADMMTQVRTAVKAVNPQFEIVHNSLYWAVGVDVDRCIKQADIFELERGFTDPNFSPASIVTVWNFVDKLHSWGIGANHLADTSLGGTVAGAHFNMACGLLSSNGNDYHYGNTGWQPTSWDATYDKNYGAALGARFQTSATQWARNFTGGVVTVDLSAKTAVLP